MQSTLQNARLDEAQAGIKIAGRNITILRYANRWRDNRNSDKLYFGAPKSLQMVTATMKLKDICSLEEKLGPTYTT